jgi:hypothetical protein
MDYEYAGSKSAAKEKGKEERSHPLLGTIQRQRIVLQYERPFKNIPKALLLTIAYRISMLQSAGFCNLIAIKYLKSSEILPLPFLTAGSFSATVGDEEGPATWSAYFEGIATHLAAGPPGVYVRVSG